MPENIMSDVTHILNIAQMYEADRLAIASGVSGAELMETAGTAIAAHIEAHWDICPLLVLCGPGNNGGDGYVIARQLMAAGWPVTVAAFGDPAALKGDARLMYDAFEGEVRPVNDIQLSENTLVVDAIFGAGFKGDLPEVIRAVFAQIAAAKLDVVAVDMPSGVDGNTGAVASGAPDALLTVSFFRPKVGHLFYPGRQKVGRLEIVDIGIPAAVLKDMDCQLVENTPAFWQDALPALSPTGHKYTRGHVAVAGGGLSSSGAARIAARAALRTAAGAVTVLCPSSALMTYSVTLEAVMVKAIPDADMFAQWLEARRIGAVLIGPGNGVSERTRQFVGKALQSSAHVVLDADALTVFEDDPDALFDLIAAKHVGQVVLTPHEAEFARLFSDDGPALERCQAAARKSGATVILKGATTVIAAPSGAAVVNICAPPWLATAGAGDALAGMVTALLSGGGSALKKVAAAVWIHSQAATRFGPGLIAEDIETEIPYILQNFN